MSPNRKPSVKDGRMVNAPTITLARQVRRMTQTRLAEQSGLKQAAISKMEVGLIPVSAIDLERIARALDFPEHFFFREGPVFGPAVPEFVHRKRAKAGVTVLNRLHAVAAVKQMHVQTLMNSWEGDWSSFPSYPIEEYEANPKRIAQTVRALWGLPPGPVVNATEIVEGAGVVVMSFDFGTRDIDGFSRYKGDGPPMVFLSSTLPPDRWRWTLIHELGHLVMHTHSDPYGEMESDANLFATEFLMPASEIAPHLTRITIDRLAGLKRYWMVSMQAIIMRASDLNMVTPNQKRYLFMQLSKAGYRLREPDTLDPPVERPQLFYRIVLHHRRNLGYSTSDLCYALALNDSDLRNWYTVDEPPLRLVN